MVNTVIETCPDSDEVIQFKETKIQSRLRSANGQSAEEPPKTTIRPAPQSDDCSKLVSLDADDVIKRAKLNDDHALYELLSKELAENGVSILSGYLANEHLVNESPFLANTTNLENELPGNVLIDEFENSIEINESVDSFNENKIAICDTNQLGSSGTFAQTATTTLQNDPFLSFLPYHFSTTSTTGCSAGKLSQAGLTASSAPVHSQSSNLSKILLSNQDINKPDQFKTDLRPTATLNGQTATDLFGFGRQPSPRSNSPSDYIKLTDCQENEHQMNQIKMNQTNGSMNSCSIGQPITSSSIESIDPIIGEKRLPSSQKLNGEDLLFSLTSEDLNDVTSYFSLLNSELKEKSSGFNCSPSLDSVDSMFCCGSSVWDSPPPSSNSSNNSSLNNDLDLPFILNSDSNDLSTSQTNEQSFLDSEFPFLSEDSIFNSFVNSNLNDLINTDAFFDEKLSDDLQFENNLNSFLSCPNFGEFGSMNDHSTLAARTKKHCTLSKDSNLAKLLREKLPVKLPSQSSETKAETNSSNPSNSLKTKKNSTTSTPANANADVNSTTVNNTNNSTNSSTNSLAAPAGKETAVDSKKNGLIARKFTIQGVNINSATPESRPKTAAVSTGCLARSIKIIDPVAVQVAGSNNVKYLLNNYTAPPNGTSQAANSFSLNISPANCLTVTTNGVTASTTGAGLVASSASSPMSTANMGPAKSFIIKSVDGKFANASCTRILYTPISRNGTNIAYTSSLTANGVQPANGLSSATAAESKTKIMAAAFTPSSLFINNRKLVQKRPYSSMSVSIPSNSSQTTKDFYSIDLVPKPITSLAAVTDTTFACSGDLSTELKKKVKTLENGISTPTTSSKSHASSKCYRFGDLF